MLAVIGCAAFFIGALWALLPKSRRTVERTAFTRLLHRVHDRREELFTGHHSPRLVGSARQHFLDAARARVRECAFLHREP